MHFLGASALSILCNRVSLWIFPAYSILHRNIHKNILARENQEQPFLAYFHKEAIKTRTSRRVAYPASTEILHLAGGPGEGDVRLTQK